MADTYCEKQWGATKIETLQISYEWVLYDFIVSGKKTGEFLESPIFSSSKYDSYKWCLKLYPKGVNENFKDYVSVYLELKAQDPYIEVQVECSILNYEREKINEKQTTHLFLKEEMYGFDDFIDIKDLVDENKHLLRDKKLTIICNVTAGVGSKNYKSENEIKEEFEFKIKLCDQLKSFFESKDLVDVTLISSDLKEFEAHKTLLAARSEVFLAMFKNEMKEKEEKKIEIPDIDGNILSKLLEYIYCGEIKSLDECAYEMLTAADKYQMKDLKTLCEHLLSSKLSTENAIKILLLADRHNCLKLKNQVIHFIIAHRTDIMKTTEFESLRNSHSSMIIDLLLTMVFNNTS